MGALSYGTTEKYVLWNFRCSLGVNYKGGKKVGYMIISRAIKTKRRFWNRELGVRLSVRDKTVLLL